jgi:hypothetical protein
MSNTFFDTNAGRVGPRKMFLIPRWSKDRSTQTAFCSYQDKMIERGRSFTPQWNASASAVATTMAL